MAAVNFTRLRDRRDELDLSNPELAEKMRLSTGYLENILCGTDSPSMKVVHRFNRVLKLPLSEILAKPTGDPSDPPKQPAGGPKAPPKRQTTERTTGPRRAAEDAA